ncbi:MULTISPECIES: hypothetical protein [Corallococcus]|uniref:hypothetical protein n=1 Tax=Corallococcus TaxID=83461 RepID=UPI000ECFAD01|nr:MULTISPECIES: hypothetical protein [Corallococcus]NPD26725.1 hypothetical protein [Corallococcus exiguus]NRD45185.1 hypothetical protein [Corallococcus exiguus]RKH97006.1 hypothetical protein D7Y04_27700 [Corallococcus sp. AB038B]
MSRIDSLLSGVLPDLAAPEGASLPLTPRAQEPSRTSAAPANSVEVFRGAGAQATTPSRAPQVAPRAREGNGFDFGVGGAFPPKPTGSLQEQLKQGARLLEQTNAAAVSVTLDKGPAMDRYARAQLGHLDPSPPIAGAPTALTDYTSTIPGVSARDAFEAFVSNPEMLFGAAGISLRPAASALTDGARLFLEEQGPPPVWAPIAVKLNETERVVHITTLDGHPLRGTNQFVFDDDGSGGTRIRQYSAFQGSSPATSVGMALMDPIERQHDIWRSVHGQLHEMLKPR